MSKKEKSNSDNLKNALCYFPFVGIIFFFIESDKSVHFKKHIKYGTLIFIAYMILNLFLGWVFGGLLFVLYVGGIGFIMWKVYSGEEVDLEYIDKFEEAIKDKVKEADGKSSKKN